MRSIRPHTTIGLKKTTKVRLDKERALGQSYDGFLSQLMDSWEESNGSVLSGKKPKRLVKEVRDKS